MNRTYLRGDMYYADLGRGIGSEQEGIAPSLFFRTTRGTNTAPPSLWRPYPAKWTPRPSCPLTIFSRRKTGWNCPLSFFWNSSAPLTRNVWAHTSDIWRKSISAESTRAGGQRWADRGSSRKLNHMPLPGLCQ